MTDWGLQQVKVTTYDAGMPYEHQCESWLLPFYARFLLICLGKQWKMAEVLKPCHSPWVTQMELQAPGSVLTQL